VSDEDWAIIKEAAVASQMTFTQWAIGVLLKAAKSKKKNINDRG
jgi:hypothetical protein